MPSPAQVQLSGQVPIAGNTLNLGAFNLTIATPIGQILQTKLVSGNNTITIPAGTSLIVVLPPITANTWTIKGVNGDTGFAINTSAAFPVVFPPGTSLTSFVINTSGNETAFATIWFI